MASLRRIKRRAVQAQGYKSQFEIDVHAIMPKGTSYESDRLSYTVEHKYTPDYKLRENVYIEAKGRFTGADRQKHLHLKKQHPDVTIHFIFMKPENTLSKGSSTTYGAWASSHGFSWTTLQKGIPESWLLQNSN